MFADPALRGLSFDIYAAAARDPELRRLLQSMMARRAGPAVRIFERGRSRGEISADLDYATALEIIEGPLIVRSIIRPELLDGIDLEALVDRMLTLLEA